MPTSLTTFCEHSKALNRAVFRQHARPRSIIVQFLRILAPSALLVLFWHQEPKIRQLIVDELEEEQEMRMKVEIAKRANEASNDTGGDEGASHEPGGELRDLGTSFLSIVRALQRHEGASPTVAPPPPSSLSPAAATTPPLGVPDVAPAALRAWQTQAEAALPTDTRRARRSQGVLRMKTDDMTSVALAASSGIIRRGGGGWGGRPHTSFLEDDPRAGRGDAILNDVARQPGRAEGAGRGRTLNVTPDDIELTNDQRDLIRANVTASIAAYVVEAEDLFYAEMVLITALLGLTFFVGKLATERASGLRHLMHISGFSRYAFWSVEGGVEGTFQAALEILVITALAAALLRVRVVVHTSLTLLFWTLFIIAGCTVATSIALHAVCRSTMISNISAMCMSIVLVFACPAYWGMQDSIATDRMPWHILGCPMLTGTSCLYICVKACASSVDGSHCVGYGDIFLHEWIMPWDVILGSIKWKETHPAGQICGMSLVVMLQIGVILFLVLVLDHFNFPSLKRNQACAKELGSHTLKATKLEHEYSACPAVPMFCSGRFKVLNGVSLSISPGAMLGLLGPNGAGKTTTIRCITGEEQATSGQVTFRSRGPGERAKSQAWFLPSASGGGAGSGGGGGGGDDAANEDEDYDTYVGLCPQETALAEDLTVMEHLVFFAEIREARDPQRSAEEFLQVVRLDAKRSEVPNHLSGGMRRRLAIGCSMVGDPDLALLDEPTTGLDPASRRNIWEAIMDARNMGTACLLTTHLLEEAEYLSTNVIIMTQGKIAAQGTVQQLKDRYSSGYSLAVDAQVGEEQRVKAYVARLLPPEHKEPVHASMHGNLVFNISKDATFVGNLFLELATSAEENGVKTWGISQSSLEDAYLRIIERTT